MCRLLHLFSLALVLSPAPLLALEFNMPSGVTDTSQSVFNLHMTIFYICLAIAVVVFGVMFWSIFHHRRSRGAKAAQFHGSVVVEIIWTIIPFLILVAIAIPATSTLSEMYDASESDVDIQVTGHQWKWHYKYIGEDVDFFSILNTSREEIENRKKKNPNYLLEVDNALVVPTNKKIRFLFTSNDVIHAWWVPDLAIKKDAIPGFINESWTRIKEPGLYRGQCAELCGKHHAFMPIEVKAVPEAEYLAWLEDQKAAKLAEAASAEQDWSMDQLMTAGATVYEKNCAVCHQADGSGVAGAFPALNGSAIVQGDKAGHLDIVVNGKLAKGMPAFGEQLSAVDIAAVITYERNSWDNQTGDHVSPAEVQTLMDKQ
jgi:cytochrome c oxidase subunit 2